MRALPLCLLLALSACSGKEPPAAFRGRTVEHWSAALASDARRGRTIDELREGGEDAVPLLVGLLEGEERIARLIAAELIAAVGERAGLAVPALKDALHSDDAALRGSAAYALGRIGPPARSALETLRGAMKDADERVAVVAATACWRISGESSKALAVLIDGLGSDDPNVRKISSQALGAVGEAAVDPLIEALGHGEARVRAGAADALGAIGPPASRARQALYKAIKDENTIVKDAADRALARIRGD